MRRGQSRISLLLLVALCLGCDPVRSINGQIRSIPPSGTTSDAKILPGVRITEVCGEREELLATSNADGNYEHASLGYWTEECELLAAVKDDSHSEARISVAALCQAQYGERRCRNVELSWNPELRQLKERPAARRLRVRFESESPKIHLYATRARRYQPICVAPCEARLLAGEHALALGNGRHEPARVWSPVVLSEHALLTGHYHEDLEMLKAGRMLLLASAGLLFIAMPIILVDQGAGTWAWVIGGTGVATAGIGAMLTDHGHPKASIDVSPLDSRPDEP